MKKINILFLVLFLVYGGLFAQSDLTKIQDTDAFQEKLFSVIETTNTIQSPFVQEKHLSVFEDVITSNGQFFFKKENQLRWEYTAPFQYLILFNNDKIWIKDDEKVSTFDTKSNQMFKQINDMMTNVLQGKILQENAEYRKEYFENDAYYYIKLYPVKEDVKEFLQEIHLSFDKEKYTVTKIKMVETSGDFTSISFTAPLLNKSIGDEKFTITK